MNEKFEVQSRTLIEEHRVSKLYIVPAILGFMLIVDTLYWEWLPLTIDTILLLGFELTSAHLGFAILLYTIWRVLTWQLREE